jgi:DNA-binding IclR family transcriptional regulator
MTPTPRKRNLVLSTSQVACLNALRDGRDSKPKIAIHAKLYLSRTADALDKLVRLRLARQDQAGKWHATARGETCLFETVPDRLPRNSAVPGPRGQRLLELLDRPMYGCEIAERLGITRQGAWQLLIKLHGQGRVSFGDPERPFWLVMRAEDKTPILSRDEERALSAIPLEYATDAAKIALAAHVSDNKVHQVLKSLIERRLVEASDGFQGGELFRITAAGLKHPQRVQSARRAQTTRLPVASERIRKVLSAIMDAGALRITEVSDAVQEPLSTINALMQYLKRKHLVIKTGQERNASYAVTDEGGVALEEMTRRRAA